jgi:predicted homoserine dehydrogenase-like protein
MYLAQAKHTPGIHVVGIADLDPARARATLARTGWDSARFAARSFADASRNAATHVTDDASALVDAPEIDIVIDCHRQSGRGHTSCARVVRPRQACGDGQRRGRCTRRDRSSPAAHASSTSSIRSPMATSPALICEMVDWCRAAGFSVVAAGKGTKYLPQYHASTPDTVWPYYGFTPEQVAAGDFNARMFNSFLDGTKSAIEMAAVANATGLTPSPGGLEFPPCGVDDLPRIPAAGRGRRPPASCPARWK